MSSDDFTQLNEKFIKARRDYENLLEASMAHPPVPTAGYGRPPYQQGPPPQQNYGNFGYSAPLPQQQQQPQSGPPQQQYNSYPPQGPPQQHYGSAQQPEQRIYSPPPEGQSNNPQLPGQNGPAPFYMIPSNQQSQVQMNQRGSPKPGSADPYANAQRQASGGNPRPQSMAYPPSTGPPQAPGIAGGGGAPPLQELAGGSFNSPVDHRNSFPPPQQPPPQTYPPQQQQQPYAESPTSVYSQHPQLPSHAPPEQPTQAPGRDPYGEQPPQHRYNLYNAGGQGQQQPSQPPPEDDAPATAQGGSYPTFNQPGSGPPGAYQAYNSGQGGAVRAGGDDEGFYR